MKKLLAIAAAVGLLAGAAAPSVDAQPYRDHDRWDHDHGRGDHDRGRWDHGRRGWDHGRDWRRGAIERGYMWRGRHWGHRSWECTWRHHQRFCMYRYW